MKSGVVVFLVSLFVATPLIGALNPQSQHEISSLEDVPTNVLFSYPYSLEWCGEDTSDSEYKVLCPDMPTFHGDNVTTLNHSDHFVLRAVFEDPDYFESLRQDGMELSDENLDGILSRMEEIWQKFIVELNFSAPYEFSQQKYKTNIVITDYGYLSGGTFNDGIPGAPHPHVQVHYEATGGYGGLAHEFTHALQNMAIGAEWFEYGGWFSESHAEFMASQMTGEVGCSAVIVDNPHHHYGTTRNRYCNWQFWEFLSEEIGFDAINKIWTSSINGPDFTLNGTTEVTEQCEELDGPFSTLLRITNWSIEDLNDAFGRWAMANVGWDYIRMGDTFRDEYKNHNEMSYEEGTWGRLTRLNLIENGEPYYAPPNYISPQRWGYNLVQLFPESDSTSIGIEFRGVVQNESARSAPFGAFEKEPFRELSPDSGWRWGVVAIQSDGTTRHSPLMSGSVANLSFEHLPEDEETYMIVLGAPTTLHQIRWDQPHYSIYRYPWRIQIDGAVPDGAQDPSYDWYEDDDSGYFHENGGGFVQDTATVASTAYVGPEAMVLGGAQVNENARIEGRATIFDSAVISGNAVVKDYARVGGGAQIYGNATIHDSAQIWGGSVYENARIGAITWLVGDTEVYGDAVIESTNVERPIRGDARIHGTAQLLGDVEFSVEEISSGVWYGFIHPEFMGLEEWGAQRTNPEMEVTMSLDNISWDEYTTSSVIQSTTHHVVLEQCITGSFESEAESQNPDDNTAIVQELEDLELPGFEAEILFLSIILTLYVTRRKV